jgi:hypothetical protein
VPVEEFFAVQLTVVSSAAENESWNCGEAGVLTESAPSRLTWAVLPP